MSKKNLLIGGIIGMIFVFFGTRSYFSVEQEKEKYSHIQKQSKSNQNRTALNSFITDINALEKKNPLNGEKIFIYSSGFFDIEMPDGRILTKNEITYHTIDFNKMTVTQNSILNGKRVDITYPFSGIYKESGLIASTYVLTVNTLGLKEFWWSPEVPNLGYDFDDGRRIACYDIKFKTK